MDLNSAWLFYFTTTLYELYIAVTRVIMSYNQENFVSYDSSRIVDQIDDYEIQNQGLQSNATPGRGYFLRRL
jgi:hypothetical protein